VGILNRFSNEWYALRWYFPSHPGTIYLTFLATLIAVPLGIAAAIYLAEYAEITGGPASFASPSSISQAFLDCIWIIRLGIFVLSLKLGTSILAASLTLGIMTLPVIISTSEEALRQFRILSEW